MSPKKKKKVEKKVQATSAKRKSVDDQLENEKLPDYLE